MQSSIFISRIKSAVYCLCVSVIFTLSGFAKAATLDEQASHTAGQIVALVQAKTNSPNDERAHRDGQQLLEQVISFTMKEFVDPIEAATLLNFANVAIQQAVENDRQMDAAKLYATAVKSMLQNLDGQQDYLDKQALGELSGRHTLGGIGLNLEKVAAGIRVVNTWENTPAAKAGILKNDVITSVDGTTTAALPLAEAVNLLRGEIGSSVSITIGRDGHSFQVRAVREIVKIKAVQARAEGDVAYLKLFQFQRDISANIRSALKELDSAGLTSPKGILIDLRGNTGGLLDETIQIADLFLETGIIMRLDLRHNTDEHVAKPGLIGEGLPMVILVNEDTASGAEILAAALRDNGRAILVGQPTFRAGSVQTIYPLPYGGAMKVTTARMISPKGVPISEGLNPDHLIDGNSETETDEQLEFALDLLRRSFH